MNYKAFLLALIVACGRTYAVASDFNPLGFYVGGSVGRSELRTTVAPAFQFTGYDFDQSNTGWKALIGVRPIPLIAAELTYVDLGHPRISPSPFLQADVLQRAQTLSGLVFAPIPLPVIDLYGRAGVARLQSSGTPYLRCPPGFFCPIFPDLQFNRTNTDFLYGAGVQWKLSALAVRLEYERINDGRGDPDFLSAGLTWTF
jgi:opacity protein-like surface antigen